MLDCKQREKGPIMERTMVVNSNLLRPLTVSSKHQLASKEHK